MRRARGNRNLLASLVGLAAGAAAASGTYWLRQRGHFGGSTRTDRDAERLETDVVDALCDDEVTGDCPIDVAMLGRGIIELSGEVPDEAASERATEVAQRVHGVHTVVNRLVVKMLETHMEATRRRHDEAVPDPRRAGESPA
jgi:osmotically-inducible protein OsmY